MYYYSRRKMGELQDDYLHLGGDRSTSLPISSEGHNGNG